MSTTKPDTNTGWGKEWPANTDIKDAYYFARRDSSKDVAVVAFAAGMMWLNGVCYQSSEVAHDLRFLGPLRPEDFEQLLRLRKAANDADEALQLIQGFDFQLDSSAHGKEIRRRAIEAIAALREALANTGEQS